MASSPLDGASGADALKLGLVRLPLACFYALSWPFQSVAMLLFCGGPLPADFGYNSYLACWLLAFAFADYCADEDDGLLWSCLDFKFGVPICGL